MFAGAACQCCLGGIRFELPEASDPSLKGNESVSWSVWLCKRFDTAVLRVYSLSMHVGIFVE